MAGYVGRGGMSDPVMFVLFIVMAIGAAYVAAFPDRMARAQLRRRYGHAWERYAKITERRLTAVVGGAVCFFALGVVGAIVAGTRWFGAG